MRASCWMISSGLSRSKYPGKKPLTHNSEYRNISDVKSRMQSLLDKVKRAHPSQGNAGRNSRGYISRRCASKISEWLSGKYEPSGEIAPCAWTNGVKKQSTTRE